MTSHDITAAKSVHLFEKVLAIVIEKEWELGFQNWCTACIHHEATFDQFLELTWDVYCTQFELPAEMNRWSKVACLALRLRGLAS